MNKSVESGDWAEYQRLVLNELERHNMLLGKMDEKLGKVGSNEVNISSIRGKKWQVSLMR